MSLSSIFLFSCILLLLLGLVNLGRNRMYSIAPIMIGLLLWVPSGDQTIVFNLSVPEIYIFFFAAMIVMTKGFLSVFLCIEILYGVGITLYLSPDYQFGFYYLRNYLLIPFGFYLCMDYLLQDRRGLQYAKSKLLLVMGIFWIWIFSNDVLGTLSRVGSDYAEGRLGGEPLLPFGNWAYLGSVQLGTLLVVSIAFTLGLSHVNKAVKWLMVLLMLYLLLRTGSRGSMLAGFGIAMFSIYSFLVRRSFTGTTLLWIFVILTILVTIGLNINNILAFNERLETLTDLDQDGSFGYRLLSIANGWTQLGLHPFGTGFAREGKVFFNEHNLFVWVSVAMGLPGIVFLLYKLLFLWTTEIYYLKLLIIALVINGFSDPILMEGIQSLFVSVVVSLGMIEFKLKKSGFIDL